LSKWHYKKRLEAACFVWFLAFLFDYAGLPSNSHKAGVLDFF
jgi:hypothetical protein